MYTYIKSEYLCNIYEPLNYFSGYSTAIFSTSLVVYKELVIFAIRAI